MESALIVYLIEILDNFGSLMDGLSFLMGAVIIFSSIGLLMMKIMYLVERHDYPHRYKVEGTDEWKEDPDFLKVLERFIQSLS